MRVAVQAIGWKGSDGRGAESGALPSGCHEAAVPAGTARDVEGGGGIEFSKNLGLVRGKVRVSQRVVAPVLGVFDSRRLR